jgi:transposase
METGIDLGLESFATLADGSAVPNPHIFRVAEMTLRLAKSISGAGWSAFLSILSFKAACAGRSVVAVPPAFTSQACSGCGVSVEKDLSVLWHACPACGASLHRDHDAAVTFPRLGQSGAGQTLQAPTWPDGASVA